MRAHVLYCCNSITTFHHNLTCPHGGMHETCLDGTYMNMLGSCFKRKKRDCVFRFVTQGQCRACDCPPPWRRRHPAGWLWSPHSPTHRHNGQAPRGACLSLPYTAAQVHSSWMDFRLCFRRMNMNIKRWSSHPCANWSVFCFVILFFFGGTKKKLVLYLSSISYCRS